MTAWHTAALACWLLLVPVAAAHVPAFDEAGSSQATAFVIDDPQKSWAFYDTLHGSHWFRFEAAAGDRIFASISLPAGETARPTLRLVTPGENSPPPQLSDDLGIEPFSPLAMRGITELDLQAPVDGTYYLVVSSDEPVAYTLAVGARETFTVWEWTTVPVERIGIQAWAGIPWALAIVGEVLAVGVVLWISRRELRSRRLVGRLGAGIVAGSAVTVLVLALVATIQAGPSAALLIPAVFAAAALGIAWGAWRAVQNDRRVAAALWGGGAVAAWAGLLVGPLLLLAYALWPQGSKPGPDMADHGPPGPA